MKNTPRQDADIERLENLAAWLDDRFRIPGTNMRFGVDALVGLVPYVGDISSFVVSGILFHTMWRKGAGVMLMLRMMGNLMLDAVVGVIPFIGDLFDFGFKANRRNVNLLKGYYADGNAKPSAKMSLFVLSLIFLTMFIALLWAVWTVSAYLFTSLWNLVAGS